MKSDSQAQIQVIDPFCRQESEPDPKRLTDFISEENFGLVEIDWDARSFTMSMRGSEGETRVTRTVSW